MPTITTDADAQRALEIARAQLLETAHTKAGLDGDGPRARTGQDHVSALSVMPITPALGEAFRTALTAAGL